MQDYVEIEVVGEKTRLGLRGQLFGTPKPHSEVLQRLETPFGQLTIICQDGKTIARGQTVPEAVVEAAHPVGIAAVKRGIGGQVNDHEVRIVRPRYGVRRRDR